MKIRGLLALAGTVVLTVSTPAAAAGGPPVVATSEPAFTFGVIGDVPYGAAQNRQFPAMVEELNERDELRFVSHVGDIKSGSTECSDAYFGKILTQFEQFERPLVYTPGDNEWVDCHRVNNGSYNPLERLERLRELFFATPGKTLGGEMPVVSQASRDLPENVTFSKQRVAFSVINVQGSNNALKPWTGIGNSEPTADQLDEVESRTEAGVAQLERTFADAERTNARAVVVMTQADMFDPGMLAEGVEQNPDLVSGFRPIVEALADGAEAFDGPIYLMNGDSHVFNEDEPLAAGSPWLGVYGQEAVEDLRRVTVEGAAESNEWLRVSVAANSAKGGDLLSWERVSFSGE